MDLYARLTVAFVLLQRLRNEVNTQTPRIRITQDKKIVAYVVGIKYALRLCGRRNS